MCLGMFIFSEAENGGSLHFSVYRLIYNKMYSAHGITLYLAISTVSTINLPKL